MGEEGGTKERDGNLCDCCLPGGECGCDCHAGIQRAKAQAGRVYREHEEMKALLEVFVMRDPIQADSHPFRGWYCEWCGWEASREDYPDWGDLPPYPTAVHEPTCLWQRVRLLLAGMEEGA